MIKRALKVIIFMKLIILTEQLILKKRVTKEKIIMTITKSGTLLHMMFQVILLHLVIWWTKKRSFYRILRTLIKSAHNQQLNPFMTVLIPVANVINLKIALRQASPSMIISIILIKICTIKRLIINTYITKSASLSSVNSWRQICWRHFSKKRSLTIGKNS